MTRHTVDTELRRYTVSPDDAVPPVRWQQVVVHGLLLDELTDRPPRGAIDVRPHGPELLPRVSRDGLIGLLGVPGRLFPKLASQSYDLELTVDAEGYLRRTLTATVDHTVNTGFPDSFTPADLARVNLHRLATVVRGRTVVPNGSDAQPVGGAKVAITGIWRTMPPADLIVAAQPPRLVSLQPGLYADRDSSAGVLRRLDLSPVGGEDKQLLAETPAGSSTLRLSDRINLYDQDVIQVDALDPDRGEYLTVRSTTGASSAAQPARVDTYQACALSHRRHAVVRKVVPQQATQGPDNPLEADALAGDVCLFLQTMHGLEPAETVELTGGGPAFAEYHAVSRFVTASDPDGYYRLPPLSRVAQIELQADHNSQLAKLKLAPDYNRRVNTRDLVLNQP